MVMETVSDTVEMDVSRITNCMNENGHGIIDWITE
jgi:hypothetical protein